MIELRTKEENKKFTDEIRKQKKVKFPYWLGAKYLSQTRKFVWNSDGADFIFNNWMYDEPNNAKGDEYCVYSNSLAYNFEWGDDQCDYQTYHAACYKTMSEPISTTSNPTTKSSVQVPTSRTSSTSIPTTKSSTTRHTGPEPKPYFNIIYI